MFRYPQYFVKPHKWSRHNIRHTEQKGSRMVRKQPGLPTKRTPARQPRLATGIVGGILLGLAGIWLGWLLLHQLGGPALPTLPTGGIIPNTAPQVQITPLVAEGITLGHTDQTPALNKQQALLIASQLEPDAASKSKNPSAQYVLLNYPNKSTPATHPDLNGVPAWMVLYQKIPLEPGDASIDPTPFPRSYYDLYVFLDANSGKELLVVRV